MQKWRQFITIHYLTEDAWNFLFLYGFILLSYWKTEIGWRRWVYSGLSFLSLSFLVSGFTWRILYSVVLTGIGYYVFIRKTAKRKDRKEKADYVAYSDL